MIKSLMNQFYQSYPNNEFQTMNDYFLKLKQGIKYQIKEYYNVKYPNVKEIDWL